MLRLPRHPAQCSKTAILNNCAGNLGNAGRTTVLPSWCVPAKPNMCLNHGNAANAKNGGKVTIQTCSTSQDVQWNWSMAYCATSTTAISSSTPLAIKTVRKRAVGFPRRRKPTLELWRVLIPLPFERSGFTSLRFLPKGLFLVGRKPK